MSLFALRTIRFLYRRKKKSRRWTLAILDPSSTLALLLGGLLRLQLQVQTLPTRPLSTGPPPTPALPGVRDLRRPKYRATRRNALLCNAMQCKAMKNMESTRAALLPPFLAFTPLPLSPGVRSSTRSFALWPARLSGSPPRFVSAAQVGTAVPIGARNSLNR